MERLISKFVFPTPLFLHKEEDEKIAPCCLACLTSLIASAHAGASMFGVAGALDVLQKKIKWGYVRCDYLCECLEKPGELDCGAGMALALMVLNSMTPAENEKHLKFLPVQLVEKINFSQNRAFSGEHEELHHLTADEAPWIADECEYHQVVGVLNTSSKTVTLWNYGEWLLPAKDLSFEEAILAVRVVSRGVNCLPLTDDEEAAVYTWKGVTLQLNQWTRSKIVSNCTLSENNHALYEPLRSLFSTAFTPAVSTQGFYKADKEHLPDDNSPQACDEKAKNAATVTVCVGGCHMSAMPCSGVGVARCLRAQMTTNVRLVAVDHNADGLSGATDFCFDESHSLFGTADSRNDDSGEDEDRVGVTELKQFDTLVNMMRQFGSDPQNAMVFYLPCTDAEVELAAKCSADREINGRLGASSDVSSEQRSPSAHKILSPSQSVLELIAKPGISAAVTYFQMAIPAHLCVSAEDTDLMAVATFCGTHGYPILVKGKKQGAAVCGGLVEVMRALQCRWAQGGFVQQLVAGSDKGIGFSAYQGRLLGCVLCSKTISDGNKKLWSGELESPPSTVVAQLERFVRDSNFTGGGELEYVEDLSGRCWAIDWNPRFPSWIFACTFTGRNLPALLVEAAVDAGRLNYSDGTMDSTTNSSVSVVSQSHEDPFSQFESVSFTKTVIELPRVNLHLIGQNNLTTGTTGTASTAKASHARPIGTRKIATQSLSIIGELTESSCATNPQHLDLKQLCSVALHSVVQDCGCDSSTRIMPTPRYVLSQLLVDKALQTHRAMVSECAQTVFEESPFVHHFSLQMCLSVKTQPHVKVLQAAREKGFLGECISLAEIRACLLSGYAPADLVLTGPGKFWDTHPNTPLPGVSRATPLRAVFADSIADLQRIVDRLADPDDWLSCEVLGVRFGPAWTAQSRFGIDCKQPELLLATAKIISQVPKSVKIGTHFHHASSNLGSAAWFDLAMSFLYLSCNFAQLSGRDISVVDFGGGWSADFVQQESNRKMVTALLRAVSESVPALTPHGEDSSATDSRLTVQFELGKSLTERAGGVITRILEIREMGSPLTTPNCSRGVILDLTIGDVSSIHTYPHPVLWLDPTTHEWHALPSGPDLLLGRSCMEFDAYGDGVALPLEARAGDLLLVAYTGAYDMSMQYAFGDGVGRQVDVW